MNKHIKTYENINYKAPLSLRDFLDRFIYICRGMLVVDTCFPEHNAVISLRNFRKTYSDLKGLDPYTKRERSLPYLWQEHPYRLDALRICNIFVPATYILYADGKHTPTTYINFPNIDMVPRQLRRHLADPRYVRSDHHRFLFDAKEDWLIAVRKRTLAKEQIIKLCNPPGIELLRTHQGVCDGD